MKTLPISVTVDVRLDGSAIRRLDRIESKLDALLEGISNVNTQQEEVAGLVAQLGGDVQQLRSDLAGISADVTDLLAKVDALPVGEPLDEQTIAELRSAVLGVNEVTQQYSDLNALYPRPADEPTDPGTDPTTPADPTEPAPPTPGE